MMWFWLLAPAAVALVTAVWMLAGPAAAVILVLLVLASLYLLGARGAGRHRNPVDAGGVWYREQPYWRRLLVVLLLTPLVVAWWFAYQLRRGWYGPVD